MDSTDMPAIAAEITQYERHRKPVHPSDEDRTITFPLTAFKDQMKCPICLNIMSNVVTTSECMHRFCDECISKSIRCGKRECPTCRKPIPSRRSLRPDQAFNRIIEILYPDRQGIEKEQEKLMEKLSKHQNLAALRESFEDGIKEQAQHRSKRAKIIRSSSSSSSRPAQQQQQQQQQRKSKAKRASFDADDDASEAGYAPSVASSRGPLDVGDQGTGMCIEVVLDRLSHRASLPVLRHKYLVVPVNACVGHLARYVEQQLSEEDKPIAGGKAMIYLGIDNEYAKQGIKKYVRNCLAAFRQFCPDEPFTLYYDLQQS